MLNDRCGVPLWRPVVVPGTIVVGPRYLSLSPRLASMTQLQVLLFASYADAFGASSVTVSVDEPATTADLVGALRALPGGSVLPETPLVAIDRRFARGIVPVHPDQEIALIPPVAGG